MSSEAEVQPRTLGEFFDLQRGTTYKSALLGRPGPVLLGLASIQRNGGFRDGNPKTYGGDSPKKLLLFPGDMYVSLKDVTQSGDLLGAVARVPRHVECGRLTQDTVKLIPRPGAEPLLSYLFWLLRTPQYRAYCRQHAMGTTNLSMSRDAFLAYDVPPFTTARKNVLRVLEALGDKIDSNRRLTANLHETAEALFTARYIDFVGVDDRESSPIGPIPRDWRVLPFSDAVEINPRVRIPKGEMRPFIEMAVVAPWATRPARLAQREAAGGCKYEPGDTLMARITGCIEHGKGAFLDFIEEGGTGSTEFLVLRAKPPLTPEAVFFLSRWEKLRAHAIANMTGSSGRQRVTMSCFDDFYVAVPPDERAVADAAEFHAAAMRRSLMLWRETMTLTAIRDELLPKLVSGEIRVSADRKSEGEELAA